MIIKITTIIITVIIFIKKLNLLFLLAWSANLRRAVSRPKHSDDSDLSPIHASLYLQAHGSIDPDEQACRPSLLGLQPCVQIWPA